jgi:hypothetical protein
VGVFRTQRPRRVMKNDSFIRLLQATAQVEIDPEVARAVFLRLAK